MAQPQNDFWFNQRWYDHDPLRNDIKDLRKKHKYIGSFPNFLVPLGYDEIFSFQTFDEHLTAVKQEFMTVRKHQLTPMEIAVIKKERDFMRLCQENVLSVIRYCSKKMVGKNGDWKKYYEQNLKWLLHEDLGGFLYTAARRGFGLNVDVLKPLMDKELRPGIDLKTTTFYKEILKINDTMLLNSTAGVDYFKNRNTGLLARRDQLNPILGAMAVEDPFKGDPALRQKCFELNREMKVNTVTNEHHNQFINICNRVKSNEQKRGGSDSGDAGRSYSPNNRGW